jgi:hypothetical protein
LPSESEIKEIKDGIKDVDEFLTASSENGLFKGYEAKYLEIFAEVRSSQNQ